MRCSSLITRNNGELIGHILLVFVVVVVVNDNKNNIMITILIIQCDWIKIINNNCNDGLISRLPSNSWHGNRWSNLNVTWQFEHRRALSIISLLNMRNSHLQLNYSRLTPSVGAPSSFAQIENKLGHLRRSVSCAVLPISLTLVTACSSLWKLH